jgi:hypothetical protein
MEIQGNMNWYRKAQEEDLLKDVVEEVVYPAPEQRSTTTCESIFMVDGEKVRLWIITGGEPALAFEDHSFSERFPVKDERWTSQSWDKGEGKYLHQNKENIVGPGLDVLPNGKWTLLDFVRRNLPLKKLRNQRYNSLPIKGNISSRKFLDRENRTKVSFQSDLNPHRFSPVSAESANYGGRMDDVVARLAPPWWKEYSSFINPLYDSNMHGASYENLSQEQFDHLVKLLEKGLASGAIVP